MFAFLLATNAKSGLRPNDAAPVCSYLRMIHLPFRLAPSRTMISFSLSDLIARSAVFADTPMKAEISATVIDGFLRIRCMTVCSLSVKCLIITSFNSTFIRLFLNFLLIDLFQIFNSKTWTHCMEHHVVSLHDFDGSLLVDFTAFFAGIVMPVTI